ncbi:MAG: STAS domain-containing protein [Bacteroidota bacterium]
MSLTIKVEHQSSSVIFSFAGKINNQDETVDILNTLDKELEQKNKSFLYDVSKLEYITSSGLNFFIRSLTRIRNVGGDIILCGVQGNVEKLLKISKLNEIFTLSPSVSDALMKVNPSI